MIRRLWDGYWAWVGAHGALGFVVAQVMACVFFTIPLAIVIGLVLERVL